MLIKHLAKLVDLLKDAKYLEQFIVFDNSKIYLPISQDVSDSLKEKLEELGCQYDTKNNIYYYEDSV